ncbi:MAG: EAL domain-containing protein [Gammaproteobacteria bacterium]|nr:EAL domain-containing protein [Gammaproteobacteria bacterium]
MAVLIFYVFYLHQKISSLTVSQDKALEGDEHFRLLLQSIPNVSVQGYDKNRRVNFWNKASENLYGYSQSEALGQLLEDLIIPDEMRETVIELTDSWLAGGQEIPPEELILKTKSGQPITVYSSHVMSHDKSGNPEMYCIDIDLTAQKQDQMAIQYSEDKFKNIIKSSPVPYLLHDSDKNIILINDVFTRQFGYTLEDLSNLLDWGLKIFPNQEYAIEIQSLWKKRFEQAERNSGIFEPLEIDIHCKYGGVRTVIADASPVANSFHGDVLISLYDITERKEEEQQRILAATVFQYSSEGMIATDADRKIVTVNPAFCRITGYSKDEVLGQPAQLLISDKKHPSFSDDLKDELDNQGEWQGEIWNKRKNGEDFIAWLTVNTIYNDDGSVHQRVALFSDITEKKAAETLALKRANYDDLTGLPNRNMFNDRLAQEIKKSNRTNKPLAIFFLDLDKFKEVNDTFGHQVGDNLLIDAAKRITDCVREADTVSRLGGDEFTVILADLDDVHSIERIANNIIDSLSLPFQLDENIAYVSASIGITLYPNDAQDVSDLLKNADQAMYMAKDSGRGCFRYFTKKMQQSAWERFNLLNDLRVALSKQQFELYYQPIMDLKTGKTHKAEALIRWHHPERGMVSPADFIPLAEDSGLIIEIGNWVFQQAVQQIKSCQRFADDFQISINKSPVQFREDSDWIATMEQEGISGNNLVIEITEGVLMENREQVEEQLLNFRDEGIQVAIDDFGTGYSSLSYLNKFDIDYLKIDQSFTRNLSSNSSEMALSEAIIVMAHKLGLNVIAEGVETKEQCDLLTEAGCDYIQGYVFSEPLPAKQFEAFLEATADGKVS